MVEEWRIIPEYGNVYEISNFGRIRSISRINKGAWGCSRTLKCKLLTIRLNKKGYSEVRLARKNTRVVHRIVAKSFIPNPNNLPQVNHIDGNKTNNRIENLEWANNSQNQLHAYKIGLQPSRAGEKNSNASITDEEVTNYKLLYNSGMNVIEISKNTDIPLSKIRAIIYGTSWKSNKTKILKRDDRKSKSKKKQGIKVRFSAA